MIQRAHICKGLSLFFAFDDIEVVVRHRGDLRQMRYADDLRVFGDAAQLQADFVGGFAADAGVDLVKDLRFGHTGVREHGVDRQHDARELAARCDFGHRLRLFAGIGGNEELDPVASEIRQRCADLLHGERDARHVELGELRLDAPGEAFAGCAALGGELLGERDGFALFLLVLRFQQRALFIGKLDVRELAAGLFEKIQHFGFGFAVFEAEPVDHFEAALHLVERG